MPDMRVRYPHRRPIASATKQRLEAAADWLVTPDEGARLLTQAGYPTRAATIRLWKHRGHLTDTGGRYHVGDLLAAAAKRKDKAA